ncbi:MAG: peptidylprolyl isomerase [Fusobacteriaceae bacterium]
MRKKIMGILMMLLILMLTGCSSVKRAFSSDESAKYNDIRVTIVTTQGDINFYLYPEATPLTVANFINLSKRGYYDNTTVHRAIENFMAQAGDPTGTGTGGPGYMIEDEIVDWLDFFQSGLLAMANAGPGTGGSQFFITTAPAEWLNGRHTVFGETIGDTDLEKSKKLEVGDVIKEIQFTGEIDLILSLNKNRVDEWNEILDKKYPNLKKYEVKPLESYTGKAAEYAKEMENIYNKNNEKQEEVKLNLIPRTIAKIEKAIGKKEKDKEEENFFED